MQEYAAMLTDTDQRLSTAQSNQPHYYRPVCIFCTHYISWLIDNLSVT